MQTKKYIETQYKKYEDKFNEMSSIERESVLALLNYIQRLEKGGRSFRHFEEEELEDFANRFRDSAASLRSLFR